MKCRSSVAEISKANINSFQYPLARDCDWPSSFLSMSRTTCAAIVDLLTVSSTSATLSKLTSNFPVFSLSEISELLVTVIFLLPITDIVRLVAVVQVVLKVNHQPPLDGTQ